MSTPTTNYGLIKAAEGEPYDVDITNNNLDSIDAQLKILKDRKRHAEYKSVGFNVAGGLVNWDAGPFAVDAANTFNNSFANTTGALSGAVNISETGLYLVSCLVYPRSAPGKSAIVVTPGGAGNTLTAAGTDGTAWEMAASFNMYLQAGTYIRITVLQTNSTVTDSKMRITKLAD